MLNPDPGPTKGKQTISTGLFHPDDFENVTK